MKKHIVIMIVVGLATSILGSCGSAKPVSAISEEDSGSYRNGTYYAKGERDERGATPEISIEVKDNKITKVVFDDIQADGVGKRDDVDYGAKMEAMTGITPTNAFLILEADLIKKQDMDAVDTVAGATVSSHKFRDVARKALNDTE